METVCPARNGEGRELDFSHNVFVFHFKMNSTFGTGDVIVRQIVQNVTEHMQEDEKDSFFLAYALLAVIICLILSYHYIFVLLSIA